MPTVQGRPVFPVPLPVIPPGAQYFPMAHTGEVFLDPRAYNERLAYYMQPIFTCEATGRHGLNWFAANQSERQDAELVQTLVPLPIRSRIVHIDTLAQRVFARLQHRFFVGERCLATVGGETYSCQVVGVFPPADIRAIMPPTPRSDPSLGGTSATRASGQRVELLSPPAPDSASLGDRYASIAHAIGTSQTLSAAAAEAQDPSADYAYSIQLLSPQGQFSASTTEARASALQRDPHVFNANVVRRYLVSAFDRGTGAYESHWLLKPHLAAQFGLPPPLPAPPNGASTQMARNRSGETRKRTAPMLANDTTAPAAKSARKETVKPAAAPRRRFPCEDLELEPIAPATPKPAFQRDLPIESAYFEELVMTWSFLNIFGSVKAVESLLTVRNALHLTNFSLDSYIKALKHTTLDPPCRLLAEIHSALAIPIVAEALRIPHTAAATSTGTLPLLAADLAELEDGMTPKDRQMAVRRALLHCRKWDRSTRLKVIDGRKGWEKHTIGALCHRGGLETIERLPAILRHLTAGVVESEAEEESEDEDASSITLDAANAGSDTSEPGLPPEEQYLSLDMGDKLVIIDFMIDLVLNGRAVRQFVDDAELNVLNLRKEYADVGKERRAAAAAKQVNDLVLAQQAAIAPVLSPALSTTGATVTPPVPTPPPPANGSASNGQHLSVPEPPAAPSHPVGSDVDELESGSEAAASTTSAEPATKGKGKSGARQTAAQKGKLKKEAAEQAKRAAAEAEAAAAAAAAKPPTEAERIERWIAELDRREESYDREVRRWTEVARARPLGSDRHHNKYWWLDGIGSMGLVSSGPSAAHIWGAGRLFVQAPTLDDLDAIESARLLKPLEPLAEGAAEPTAEALFEARRRLEEGPDSTPLPISSWAYIDSEETIDQLLAWLNPKGQREVALHAALTTWRPNIVGGMLKRKADLEREVKRIEAAASKPKGRSGKLMTTSAADGPSYLTYVNRLAVQPR